MCINLYEFSIWLYQFAYNLKLDILFDLIYFSEITYKTDILSELPFQDYIPRGYAQSL